MAQLSERQRLWVTIGASVLLSGGITALVFMDRQEIQDTDGEIQALEEQISAADVEIKKTKDREDKVIVFREVAPRELEILPQRQQIADFHANLTMFLTQAGAKLTKIPENAPKESELARGVYVTPNTIECEADSASLLRLVNMIEIDPRLVSVVGLKIHGGSRQKDADHAPTHKVTLNLETYFYNPPATGVKMVQIPNVEMRLDDPKIHQEIASFQPERRDSYTLRPSASRRDPFVDMRREVVVEDPAATAVRYKGEETTTVDVEKRLDELREKSEIEKALIAKGNLFEADRIGQEIDLLLNELKLRLANITSLKSVSFPDLAGRVEHTRTSTEEVALIRKKQPRELTITLAVATMTRDLIAAAFRKGDYAEVSSLSVAWEQFCRGKSVDPASQALLDEIKTFRRRSKTLAEFHQKAIHITAVILNPNQPSQSVALINGKSLRVGDALDEGGQVQVQGIARDGVQFVYMGETIVIRREDASATAIRRSGDGSSATVSPGPVPVGEAPRR